MSTRWTFTVNSDPESFELKESGVVTRAVYQTETAPSTGHVHIQGYIEFRKTMSMDLVKKYLGNDVHVEIARGNSSQNFEYCTKPGGKNQRIYGNWTRKQGKRSDLDSAKEAILAGSSEKTVSMDHFNAWCKYYKAFDRFRLLHCRPVWRDLEVTVIFGNAGVGKSRKVYDEHGDKVYRILSYDPLWFDGYDQHEVLLLDDYRGGLLKTQTLLTLLDGHPYQLPIKGSSVWAHYTKVYITTNDTTWIHWVDSHSQKALERRVKHTVEMVEK